MVTVWWSAAHLIHFSFLNLNETITSEKYAQQIDEMHGKLQCLQANIGQQKGPNFLHNIAQPHIRQPVLQKLNELGYEIWPHPLWDVISCQQTTKSSSNPEAQIFMLQE